MNSLKQYKAVYFHCMQFEGYEEYVFQVKSKYFESKLQTICFYLI